MEAINLERGEFVAEDGPLYPITNYIDADGNDCAPDEAFAAVAGRDSTWFALNLSDFTGRTHS